MSDAHTSPWTYAAYPANMPPDAFGPLQGFVDLWRKKAPANGQFPQWRDFHILDFEGWWGQISLAGIHRDPFDFRWALWGTRITDWWGVDYTNRFISQIPEIQVVWVNFEKPYIERIVGERLIGHVSGTLTPQARRYLFIRGVDLPLEKDGQVSRVMSAYQLCEPGDGASPDLEPIFRLGPGI